MEDVVAVLIFPEDWIAPSMIDQEIIARDSGEITDMRHERVLPEGYCDGNRENNTRMKLATVYSNKTCENKRAAHQSTSEVLWKWLTVGIQC